MESLSLVDRILAVASIEEVEAEQQRLSAQLVEIQNQIDALDVALRMLRTARDGKPQRKTRETPTPPTVRVKRVPLTEVEDIAPTETLREDMPSKPRSLTAQAIVDLLLAREPLTTGDVSRHLNLVYGTAHASLANLVKLGKIQKIGSMYTIR